MSKKKKSKSKSSPAADTVCVLIHRARAVPSEPRPIPMSDVLAAAGASNQWWNKLSRGLVQNPSADLVGGLAIAAGVSLRKLKAAIAETNRRVAAGEPV